MAHSSSPIMLIVEPPAKGSRATASAIASPAGSR